MQLNLRPVYFPNEEKSIDETLFVPVFKIATSCKCLSAYFTSGVVSELARSLTLFFSNPNSSIQFLISPILNPADHDALLKGVKTESNLLPLIFPGFNTDEDTLRSRAVEALSVLVATKRVEFRMATMDESAMLHAKIWLFDCGDRRISFNGSSNATQPGLRSNFEQLRVDQEEVENGTPIYNEFDTRFDRIWNNEYQSIRTFPMNETTLTALESLRTRSNHTGAQIQRLLLTALENADITHSAQSLKVPSWLNYDHGDFAHQGEAIRAWSNAGNRGILSIATGGGKTLTSLTSAALLQSSVKNLLLIILVPTTPLASQWTDEVRLFSCEPVSSALSSGDGLIGEIRTMFRRLSTEVSKTEVLILTRDTYLTPRVRRLLEQHAETVETMLICDEVHNFGAPGFREQPIDFYKYRLGLSATVEREYDEEGTQFLKSYFGPVVYEFTLKQAIGKCLVPFSYYPKIVRLTAAEEDQWIELTEKIKRLSFAENLPPDDDAAIRLKTLRLDRRRLVENADNKVTAFKSDLPEDARQISKALVFCSDKKPTQLEEINAHLSRIGVYFHQITATETGSPSALKDIVDKYSAGALQVLTSKRVIDEGFNAPQTERAYLLATHTGRRQWIQRLGRVLRKSPATGKTSAAVYDYVAVPAAIDRYIDKDFKSLLRSELDRVTFFAELSENGQEPDGSVAVIGRLIEMLERTI
jgi:superfamily II DNA or RNA helicase